jgi:hypothetical protein
MTDYRYNERRSWTQWARWGIIVLLVIVTGWFTARLYRVWKAAAALRSDVQVARALAERGVQGVDLQEVDHLLDATREDLAALQAAAGPFLRLAPHMGWVPRYGPTIQAAPALLDMAAHLTAAGEQILEPFMPLVQQIEDDTPPDASVISLATATLTDGQPHFDAAMTAVQEARAARQSLDTARLDPRLRGWVLELDAYLPLLERGIRAALLAPELLGAEGPRTYLVLVQNEDELRATGGFISGVSQLRVVDGQIEVMPFEDSYAIDDFSQSYPDPPKPLGEIMLADLWVFRDGNWSPDFPTAARKAIELFRISRDVEIDGVIALDQRAISLLLDPLGPLQVAGVEEPITGQNVLAVARRAWAPGEAADPDWWRQRKDIMGQVLDAAMARLLGGLRRDQLVGLSRAALKALGERHVLLYMKDPDAATLLREMGWDGALLRPSGDYQMVVDHNMGFNKVNAVVEERLEYAVDLSDPDRPRSLLTVRHHHPVQGWRGPCSQEPRYVTTYDDMTRRCYYDYLRVYVPSGADLLHATPHPLPGSILLSGQRLQGEADVSQGEADKTVFSTFLVLRPGESMETSFEYALPGTVVQRTEEGWRYRLTVQKQPGTDARPVTVFVELPAGAEIVVADPPPTERSRGILTYAMELRTDLQLDVTWRIGDE